MPVDSCDESDATNARGRVVGGSAREREKVVVGSSVRAQYKALAGGRKWYSGAPAKSILAEEEDDYEVGVGIKGGEGPIPLISDEDEDINDFVVPDDAEESEDGTLYIYTDR